jgi:FkbM family methyltransferase
VHQAYDFGPMPHAPTIIDCGANIGLAQIYWKIRYGDFNGICFEPDPGIATLLRKNLKEWSIQTQCIESALSSYDGGASFHSDLTDAGRLTPPSAEDTKIKVTRLSPFLEQPVDLLKIDIEGEEFPVLEEIREKLANVSRIFVEAHFYKNKKQPLSDILQLLEHAGFRTAIMPGVKPGKLWEDDGQADGSLVQTFNIFGIKPSIPTPAASH